NNQPLSGRPSVSPLAFLSAVKADGLATFDAWDHHPYYSNPSRTPASAVSSGGGVARRHRHPLIPPLAPPRAHKPHLSTQRGRERNAPDSILGVSWAKQAQYLTQAYAIVRRNPRIDLMLWFLLRDDTNLNGWQSGLMTAGGKKKPAFAAFESMASGF